VALCDTQKSSTSFDYQMTAKGTVGESTCLARTWDICDTLPDQKCGQKVVKNCMNASAAHLSTFRFSKLKNSFKKNRTKYRSIGQTTIDIAISIDHFFPVTLSPSHFVPGVQSFGASERASSTVVPKLLLYLFLPSC
jgi:hypothetical protein